LGEQKKALAARAGLQDERRRNGELEAVRKRLEKLVGKLAALEDSWT
jgi:hypothetical protein